MKLIVFISLFFFLSGNHLFSQGFEKQTFGKGNDYYLAQKPQSDSISGVLLLLSGFGQDAESILRESRLARKAYMNAILTIVIGNDSKIYVDKELEQKLDNLFDHVKKTYRLDEQKFIMGGFSAGGSISLRYTERCHERGKNAPVLPAAVFTVDSPVDLFEIWDYFQREIERNYSEPGYREALYVSSLMQKEIGNPYDNEQVYNQLTPYKVRQSTAGNEGYLLDIPVRLYHDVDIKWQMDVKQRSLYDSNALPASDLIRSLRVQGNQDASFIQGKKGYRSNGQRHPHSWSIIDEEEFISWANSIFND